MTPKFDIRPMNVGAEIIGLDTSGGINDDTARAIREAWLEYGFLVFRDMHGGHAEHVALSRCLGELEQHPVKELRLKEAPDLIELGRRSFGQAYVFNGDELRLGRFPWHRDTSYTPAICKGAVLRMEEIPPENGETCFADAAKAYDALPEDVKQRIEGLEHVARIRPLVLERTFGSFWDDIRVATPEEHEGKDTIDESFRDRFPPVIHPLVITHPDTGRKSIYICPNAADHIIGMEAEESRALLQMLVDHMTQKRFTYVHSWRAGDIISWDNRRCLHATLGYHPRYMRTGYRTTLAGPLVTGRYLEKSAA
jgi:taurine dioxygenase